MLKVLYGSKVKDRRPSKVRLKTEDLLKDFLYPSQNENLLKAFYGPKIYKRASKDRRDVKGFLWIKEQLKAFYEPKIPSQVFYRQKTY